MLSQRRMLLALGVTVLLALDSRALTSAQQQRGNLGGLVPTRPVMPLEQPRPPQGQVRAEQWLGTRPADDNEPVGSFVESLKGNDVAFELIVGKGRLFTTKEPIAVDGGVAVIAVGDPSVLDFDVLPNQRMLRLLGRRAGVTDLTITTADGKTYSFEVHVTYDLELLRAHLRQLYPEATLTLAQIREHLVVEGQARSTAQVSQIIQTLQAYLVSVQVPRTEQGTTAPEAEGAMGRPTERGVPEATPDEVPPPIDGRDGSREEPVGRVSPEQNRPSVQGSFAAAQIINLIRVPGVQQVLLQVKIAELNRTALREIGADIVVNSEKAILGTRIAGNSIQLGGGGDMIEQALSLGLGNGTTAFGIFPTGELDIFLRALRRNSVLNVLAEPNLVAMHGQEASFLAGGEFPVPVPQAGVGVGAITIEFKQFGVQLNFTPYILDDESIRLRVAPEASTVDDALGTELQGTVVPGVNTRRVNTTVQLKQGQTLALAGLLSVEMDGQTSRIPVLGDLPYLGPMFSNTSHRRQEKELLVMVTPYLISPMDGMQVPPLPGQEIMAPNDLEFYLLSRIEGRTGRPHRPTTNWDNPLGFVELFHLESRNTCGPVGFSTP